MGRFYRPFPTFAKMICVPIFGKDEEEVLSKAKKASSLCDILELRLDLSGDISENGLKSLIASLPLPIIVTNRSSKEGGKCCKDEEERIYQLEKAAEFGADFIDVEFSTKGALRKRLKRQCDKFKSKIILSYHDFQKTPSQKELFSLFDQMADFDPAVIKIVTHACDSLDFLPIANLYPRAREKGVGFIGFCMGKDGCYSRLFCLKLGAFLTFACLEQAASSAPGQIPVKIMREITKTLALFC